MDGADTKGKDDCRNDREQRVIEEVMHPPSGRKKSHSCTTRCTVLVSTLYDPHNIGPLVRNLKSDVRHPHSILAVTNILPILLFWRSEHGVDCLQFLMDGERLLGYIYFINLKKI